jgi:hypothetical protein
MILMFPHDLLVFFTLGSEVATPLLHPLLTTLAYRGEKVVHSEKKKSEPGLKTRSGPVTLFGPP